MRFSVPLLAAITGTLMLVPAAKVSAMQGTARVTPTAGSPRPLATPMPPEPAVTYRDGRLSVQASGASLADVMRAVAAATGAEVRGTVPERPVSAHFDNLRMSAAMARLLGQESFMLRYAPGGTLRSIDLVNRGMAAAPGMPTPTPVRPLDLEQRHAATLKQTVKVEGPLAEALGGGEASIGRVLHAAIGEQNPEVREAAQARIISAFAEHPEAEAAYFSTLQPVADETLAEIFASQGPGAEELLGALVVRVRSPALRTKVVKVLGALRSRPSAPAQQ